VRISTFRGVNYKCFAATEEIRFEPGFNVIVGRNNAGKTALAEVLSLRFSAKPHRSSMSVPRLNAQPDPESRAEVSIMLKADELTDLLLREMPTFYVPTEAQEAPTGRAMFRTVLSEGVTVNATFLNGSYHSAKLSTYTGTTPPRAYMRFTMDHSGNPSSAGPLLDMASDYPELAAGVAAKFHERLYYFSAVRFGIDDRTRRRRPRAPGIQFRG
jgi:hypothetical protein